MHLAAYLLPLLTQHSMVWSGASSQPTVSPSHGKKVKCAFTILTFWGYAQLVSVSLDSWSTDRKGSKHTWACWEQRQALLLPAAQRGSYCGHTPGGNSWKETSKWLQLGSYTHKPRGNKHIDRRGLRRSQADWWRSFPVQNQPLKTKIVGFFQMPKFQQQK